MNKNGRKIAILVFLVLFSTAGVFSFPRTYSRAESADDIQDDIASTKKKLEKEKAALAEYIKQLSNINFSVTQTQKDIQTTEKYIKQLEDDISRSEKELAAQDQKMKIQRQILAGLLQEVYYTQRESLPLISLAQQDFSEIFSKRDNLLSLEEKINELIDQLKGMQAVTLETKNSLELSQDQKEKLLAIKERQKNELLVDKAETQDDIAEKEATIGELQKKMAQLQGDLNRILGKSYSTGDIKEAIQFAHKVTGVREGFLFGVLSMESGGNPLAGKCTFDNAGMSTARKTYFKQICSELKYDYKKRPVSCASKSYPGSGGAMGAAQFMSDTWTGYKSQIASATGNNPPDPWSLSDGIVAMALKLKNDGATKSGTTSIKNPCNGKSVKVKWEIYASMRYLGWTCYGYTNYAPGIQSLANGYSKL